MPKTVFLITFIEFNFRMLLHEMTNIELINSAPFVFESSLQIGLSLVQINHLDINGCDMVIGKIEIVKVPFNIVAEDGALKLEQLNLCSVSGLDGYHTHVKMGRFSYAKPDKKPFIID